MKHFHINTLNSTQDYLKNLSPLLDDRILVSCNHQTEGYGRRGTSWSHYPQSLAMSFTLLPNSTPSLTPLEIGIHFCHFFKKFFKVDLYLKWPNDIYNLSKAKVGGILIDKTGNGPCIVGVGLNLDKENIQQETNFEYKREGILNSSNVDLEKLASQIYYYILENRLESEEVVNTWPKLCLHINKKVSFLESEKCFQYIFRGIGDNGEALLSNEQGELLAKYSGSVRI